jgi:DNA-binding response OmpR family regulator
MLIKGPVEKLLGENKNDNFTEQLKMIERNSKNLQILIDQLLELSHLEAASIPLRAKEENLISLLRGLTFSFESLAQEKNIKLNFNSDKESIIVWIDRDKLEKIINNLLSNAIKFTKDGGTISVNVKLNADGHNETAQVLISDTGIGIPENKIEKIFDRFYQADDSTKKNYGGSGIGLALVKELIELHKWSISVNSKENVGTEFQLKIPVGDYLEKNEKSDENLFIENILKEKINYPSNEQIEDTHEITNSFVAKSSILIVDDSEDVRLYLSGLLKLDYNITEAKNGREGINLAFENSPDLIISDIMMSEMDGIEFCKKIKTDFQTSHIPVILLTAKVSDKSKIEGLETGADDYLTKPFNSTELFIRVKNLLEQRKRLREKFSKEINLQPNSVTTNIVDNEFLKKAFDAVEKNLDNIEFDSETLAKELFVSLSQLRRKLLAITGQAPGEFLRTYKLKRAAQMLLEKKLSVTQIAFEVGFNSSSHFTKAFHQQFNCLPSEFTG